MIGLLLTAALAIATPGPTGGTGLSTAANALRSDPVYVAPEQASTIDLLAVRQAVSAAPHLEVAVLPDAAAGEAGNDPAAVPGVLSGQIGRGGTLLVLIGNTLEASSTTLGATAVQDALVTAEPLLHADTASRTAAVTAAVRLLGGGGSRGLGEASSPAPHSAGNPAGISGLIALAVLVVAGLGALLVLPRLRRRQAAVPPPPRTVYVDSWGRITGVSRSNAPPRAEDGRSGDAVTSPPVDTSDRPPSTPRAGKEDR